MTAARRRSLVVEHAGGPLAGRSQTFAPDVVRIVIGTDEHCALRLPAGTPGVDAEHCELRRDAGRYELRVNRDAAVLLDGRPGRDGDELADGAELALGGTDGPRLRVRYVAAAPLAGRGRRLAIVGVVALLAGLAAAAWVHERRVARESERALADLLLAAPDPQRPVDWSAVLAQVRPSVYAVIARTQSGEDRLGATAWVVAPGRLATNAHVGRSVQRLLAQRPKVSAAVRSSVPPYATHAITRVTIHPGYAAFTAEWLRYAPMKFEDGDYAPLYAPGAYDVAILEVEDGASLEPPLALADDASLQQLRPGTPLAFAGFPAEGLLDTDVQRPNPRSQTGAVVSLTTFTRTQTTAAQAQLIEHSLPATGGASGSPIVNARGEVVALLNAGNVIADGNGNRAPNAALVNFAQRVDVLRPLLDPTQPFALEDARRAWRAELAQYVRQFTVAQRKIERTLASWREGAPPDAVASRLDRPLDFGAPPDAEAAAGGTGDTDAAPRFGTLRAPFMLERGEWLVAVTVEPCGVVDARLVPPEGADDTAELARFEDGACYALLEANAERRLPASLELRVRPPEDSGIRDGIAHVVAYRRAAPHRQSP